MLTVELETITMAILVERQEEFVVMETTMIQAIEVVEVVQFIQAVVMDTTMTMVDLDVSEEVYTQVELVEEREDILQELEDVFLIDQLTTDLTVQLLDHTELDQL